MGRVLEEMSGVGEVYEGDEKVGAARYAITVYQETVAVGGGQEIDGMRDLSGTVEVEPPLSGFSLVGKKLSLRLEDGRWWDFVMKNSNGRALNSGQGLR